MRSIAGPKLAWAKIEAHGADKRTATVYYAMIRDFLKAAAQAWGEAWGDSGYMVTKPVTLKALV